MKKRLTGIVTKDGDDGTSVLSSGQRLKKNNIAIAVLGELDELNSFMGLLVSEVWIAQFRKMLLRVQHELFDLGIEFSTSFEVTKRYDVERLEAEIQELESMYPEIKGFILPGGSRSAALAHVCRAICRRVERTVIQYHAEQGVHAEQGINNPTIKPYINRLSDWFFVLACALNSKTGMSEIFWTKDPTWL